MSDEAALVSKTLKEASFDLELQTIAPIEMFWRPK